MPKFILNLLYVLAFVAGYTVLTVGLFGLFGYWSLVGCAVPLLIPILFLDIEESDNG